MAKKRQRPEQICFACGKQKQIYTHLGGEQDKPLCSACNMRLRRDSPGAAQVRLCKLGMAAVGSMETMLALPVEEKQKRSLQDMQDELKLMIREVAYRRFDEMERKAFEAGMRPPVEGDVDDL